MSVAISNEFKTPSDVRKRNRDYFRTENGRRARSRASLAYKDRIKEKIFALLGGLCRHCGFDNKLALQIDHINGGGGKERSMFKSPTTYYSNVLRTIELGDEKYQLLCANCNVIKKMVNKEF